MSALEPGDVIDGRYEVIGKLGAGGMGVVYLATQKSLGREVAIKMLLPQLSRGGEERVRFRREARVMSQLRHEHAVEVYDYGDWEGQVYLVMERLHGVTLRDRLAGGQPYGDAHKVLEIAHQIADVLIAAHDLSLVHRDLKPENIMLERRADGSRRAVVVDFGLAFLTHGSPDLNRLTTDGLISGTPQYMAPEQARGQEITSAADIYALGGIIWEMMIGVPAFDAATPMELLNKQLFLPARSMREVRPDAHIPMALDDLVLAMLEKDAADRPSAVAAHARLGELLLGHDPRDRGRPERMMGERSQRALTHSQKPASGGPQPTIQEAPGDRAAVAATTEAKVKVFLVGKPGNAEVMALGAGGFALAKTIEAADIVWVLADGELDPSTVDKPTVATRNFDSADELAALVRSGFADVIAPDTDDATVVKRLMRAARRARRDARGRKS